MTINDIIMFSKSENIILTESEYFKIFGVIKNNWQELLKNDELIKEYLNKNFDKDKSNKIYDVFLKYKKKYSSYL